MASGSEIEMSPIKDEKDQIAGLIPVRWCIHCLSVSIQFCGFVGWYCHQGHSCAETDEISQSEGSDSVAQSTCPVP